MLLDILSPVLSDIEYITTSDIGPLCFALFLTYTPLSLSTANTASIYIFLIPFFKKRNRSTDTKHVT